MLRMGTIGFYLILFLISSCGTVKNNHVIIDGHYQIKSIVSDKTISVNEVHVIGKVLDARTKVICSDGVVKNLINDKEMVFTDSLGNFKLFLKSENIKLKFSHSGNSDLETDTIFVSGGQIVEVIVFLGSDIIYD